MLPGRTLLSFRGHFARSVRTVGTSGTQRSSQSLVQAPKLAPRLTLLGGSTLAVLVWTLPPADCAAGAGAETGAEGSSNNGPAEDDVTKEVDEVETLILNTLTPLAKRLGYGGFMGFLSGYALKYVGKVAAVVVGTGFVALQIAQYKGMVDIDYGQVEDQVTSILDADGDGELTSKDAIIWWRKLKSILTQHLPSTSGFSAGFAMGIYYG